jgi:hypothetical protein
MKKNSEGVPMISLPKNGPSGADSTEKKDAGDLRDKRKRDFLGLRKKLSLAYLNNGCLKGVKEDNSIKNRIITSRLRERLIESGVIIKEGSMVELDSKTLKDIVDILTSEMIDNGDVKTKKDELCLDNEALLIISKWPESGKESGYSNAAEFIKGEYDSKRDGKIYYNDLRKINFRLYNAIASYKKRHNDDVLEKLLPTINKKIDEEVRVFSDGELSLSDLPYKEADKMRKRIDSRKVG